ncbi:Six-hairpin glycosidase-like protein [Bisporella sp. PMI_857]|nr:Six-hairpin glycosidase-like protein [Bisporella sp. PMI_857]
MKLLIHVLAVSNGMAHATSINRQKVVRQFNPVRHASSNPTPMQVGNGNFAFGADITGLQTFQPFNTLSSWGWHNFSLPTTPGQSSVNDFTGLDWWTHERLVNYNQPNPAQPLISNWLIQNPQRLNLGRVGLWFDPKLGITESNMFNATQILDLYSGVITSQFTVLGSEVKIQTSVDPYSDTVAILINSDLLKMRGLGVFFDYPYSDLNKFNAPFVGPFNKTDLHTTTLQQTKSRAQITHNIDTVIYYTTIKWSGDSTISNPKDGSHRYTLHPGKTDGSELTITTNFSPSRFSLTQRTELASAHEIFSKSRKWWSEYWESGAFLDLTTAKNANATELQRRVILSQYLLAINDAGRDPPQESGLANNGWYGKFHLEMILWHLAQWGRWGKWSLFNRAVPGVYTRFLETSVQRAKRQGYEGARWGKMSDPTGRSAPGEINSLLIWQQPHPFYFAEMEYRAFPTKETLRKWDNILTKSAEFMVSFAWWNASTGVYDLGPPMYPVSENTKPNNTINPTFELAYWRFGLNIATYWKSRQNLPTPANWTHVLNNLAPLPIDSATDTYPVYESIPNMWIDPNTFYDHPAMSGIFGLLPPTLGFNLTVSKNTATRIAEKWNFKNLFGWDFPMLAMNAVRLQDAETAVKYLLDPNWEFDDVGMPIGGPRVPTPYFPSSGGLLLAAAMMAGGWDGSEGPHFPADWVVNAEGFEPSM